MTKIRLPNSHTVLYSPLGCVANVLQHIFECRDWYETRYAPHAGSSCFSPCCRPQKFHPHDPGRRPYEELVARCHKGQPCSPWSSWRPRTVAGCDAVSTRRGTPRPCGGGQAQEHGLVCSGLPELDEPHLQAYAPPRARGVADEQHAPPVRREAAAVFLNTRSLCGRTTVSCGCPGTPCRGLHSSWADAPSKKGHRRRCTGRRHPVLLCV